MITGWTVDRFEGSSRRLGCQKGNQHNHTPPVTRRDQPRSDYVTVRVRSACLGVWSGMYRCSLDRTVALLESGARVRSLSWWFPACLGVVKRQLPPLSSRVSSSGWAHRYAGIGCSALFANGPLFGDLVALGTAMLGLSSWAGRRALRPSGFRSFSCKTRRDMRDGKNRPPEA